MARTMTQRPRTKVPPQRKARTVRLSPALDSRLYHAALARGWTVHETIVTALLDWLAVSDADQARIDSVLERLGPHAPQGKEEKDRLGE